MQDIHQIQAAIEALPHGEYARLREWFAQRDWKHWDKQIADDGRAGRLSFLAKEAAADKAAGRLRDL